MASHPGYFKVLAGNLHIKKVFAGEGIAQRRYVIAYNPVQTKMESINRAKNWNDYALNWVCSTVKRKTKPNAKSYLYKSLGRYVKELKSLKLKNNKTKVQQESS